MEEKKTKSIFILLIALSIIFSLNLISAANAANLSNPAQDESISGTYMLNASVDTNTLGLNNATFSYETGGVNTTIVSIANYSGDLEFNTTWITTALQDINDLTIWVNITNETFEASTIDSSTGVDINNGNPTATLRVDHFHDNFAVGGDDTFVVGLDADTTIGISTCDIHFLDIDDDSLDNTTALTVSGDACTDTLTISNIVGLSPGKTYGVFVEAGDGNGDKTNSSERTLIYRSVGGPIITVPTGPPLEIREKLANLFANIRDKLLEIWERVKGIFTK